eukprot:9502819-Pyramimonas_sp.AAC.1
MSQRTRWRAGTSLRVGDPSGRGIMMTSTTAATMTTVAVMVAIMTMTAAMPMTAPLVTMVKMLMSTCW